MRIQNINLLLLLVACGAIADDSGENALLEKMFQDIITTIPSDQKRLIDSASKSYSGEPVLKMGKQPLQDTVPQSPIVSPTDEQSELLKQMIQNIQTNREKRMIHFMSTDPEADVK